MPAAVGIERPVRRTTTDPGLRVRPRTAAADVEPREEWTRAPIEFCDVDILCLSEIKATDRSTDRWTNQTLSEAFRELSVRTGESWVHELFPDSNGGGDQLTGIAWDQSAVTALGDAWRFPVSHEAYNGRTVWHRPPYGLKFQAAPGMTDFVVVPLHLKSDYRGDFSAHRDREFEELLRVIAEAELHFVDEDLVFIGDSNAGEHDESGVARFTQSGYRDLNAHDFPTHYQRSYGALDRAFVPETEAEFTRSSAWIHRYDYLGQAGWSSALFLDRCSDHFLLSMAVLVAEDDD